MHQSDDDKIQPVDSRLNKSTFVNGLSGVFCPSSFFTKNGRLTIKHQEEDGVLPGFTTDSLL